MNRTTAAPLMPLFMAMATGVAVFSVCGIWWPAAAGAACGIAALLCKRAAAGGCLLMFAIGCAAALINTPVHINATPGTYHVFGTVTAFSESDAAVILTVKADTVNCNPIDGLKCRVIVPRYSWGNDAGPAGCQIGSRVSATGRMKSTQVCRTLDKLGRSDLYEWVKGIDCTVFVNKDSLAVTGTDNRVYYRIRRCGEMVIDRLCESKLSSEAIGFESALLTGNTSLLSSEQRELHASAGIAHILALSGLHVGLISLMLLGITSPLSLIGLRKWRLALCVAALWMFAVMCGLPPSVVRASVMFTIAMAGLIIERPANALNALMAAGIVILLFTPRELFWVGFQLSFIASGAILIYSGYVRRERTGMPRWGARLRRSITEALLVTLVATVATLPLCAYWFGKLPVYFLPANMVAALTVPVLLCGGVLLVLTGSNLVAEFLNFVYYCQSGVAEWLSQLAGASLRIEGVAWWEVTVCYVVLGLWLMAFIRKENRRLWVGAASIVTVLLLVLAI